ncbi:hypothetical protein, partial [Candidatus Skiveiella danica]|uniref:hypothetical protein n=1 Tax=Candidatus Skiveiella danica TaxID=3386177 RepID=UPI0039B92637
MHEQVVLGKETGEKHPVPVLVGYFFQQAIKLLHCRCAIPQVAELPPVDAQLAAKLFLFRREVGRWVGFSYAE